MKLAVAIVSFCICAPVVPLEAPSAPVQERVILLYPDTVVPMEYIVRIIGEESGGDARAIGYNSDGSFDGGIMQINSRTYPDMVWFDNGGIDFDIFNPREAIPVAARYIQRLYRALGSWPLTIAAYNCGIGKVRRGQIPQKTKDYVRRITGCSL